MSENILFLAKKHGRLNKKRPRWKSLGWFGLIDSEIILTTKRLQIYPKNKKKSPVIIPLKEIESVIKENYPEKDPKYYFTEIFPKNGPQFYVTFYSEFFGIQHHLVNEFYNTLKVQIDKVKREEEMKILTESQKGTNIFYINIPPQTRLTAIKCPSCQAPLELMPPCKCEHCGVMIELMK